MWEQPKHPLMDEWKKKIWYLYTMEYYYLALGKKKPCHLWQHERTQRLFCSAKCPAQRTNTASSHLYLGSRKFTFIIIFMMYIKAESETVVTRSWGLEGVGQRTQSFGNVEWKASEDLMTVAAVNNTICVWNLLKHWILKVFTICFNGLPNGSPDKEFTWSTREAGFDPWVRKIPWRREITTHSSALAWKLPWTQETAGYSPWGRKDVMLYMWVLLRDWNLNVFTLYTHKDN